VLFTGRYLDTLGYILVSDTSVLVIHLYHYRYMESCCSGCDSQDDIYYRLYSLVDPDRSIHNTTVHILYYNTIGRWNHAVQDGLRIGQYYDIPMCIIT
jgi:hypothetical protein